MQLIGETLLKSGINPFCIRLKAIHGLVRKWCVMAVDCLPGPETDRGCNLENLGIWVSKSLPDRGSLIFGNK